MVPFMKTKLIMVSVFAFVLSGCAGMSESMQKSAGVGVVTADQSDFDCAREVQMTPAFVAPSDGGMATIKMGLSWRSTTEDQVGVLIRFSSLTEYQTISSVELNIDGQFYELEPAEAVTNIDSERLTNTTCTYAAGCTSGLVLKESDKMFLASFDVIKKIPSANKALVKVGNGRSYQVGDLLADSYGNVTVLDVLPEFLDKVER